MNEAVSLAIHGLWSEGGRHQINLFIAVKNLLFFLINDFNLYKSVLLRVHTLPFCSIVICAHLIVQWRENRGPLSKLNNVALSKLIELPFNKGVIVWILVCGYKGPPVIHCCSHGLDVLLSKLGKVIKPVMRVLKFGYYLFWNVHLFHYLVLSLRSCCLLLAESLKLLGSVFL